MKPRRRQRYISSMTGRNAAAPRASAEAARRTSASRAPGCMVATSVWLPIARGTPGRVQHHIIDCWRTVRNARAQQLHRDAGVARLRSKARRSCRQRSRSAGDPAGGACAQMAEQLQQRRRGDRQRRNADRRRCGRSTAGKAPVPLAWCARRRRVGGGARRRPPGTDGSLSDRRPPVRRTGCRSWPSSASPHR